MAKSDFLTSASPTILQLKDLEREKASDATLPPEQDIQEDESAFETEFPQTWNILLESLESMLDIFTPYSLKKNNDRFCVLSYPDDDKPRCFTFGIPACPDQEMETLCKDLQEDEVLIHSDVKRALNHVYGLFDQQSNLDIDYYFDDDETLMITTSKPLHLLTAIAGILKEHNVYTIDAGFDHGFTDVTNEGQTAFFEKFVSDALDEPEMSDRLLGLMPARSYSNFRSAYNSAFMVSEIAHLHFSLANFEGVIREEMGYPQMSSSALNPKIDPRYFLAN